MGLVGRRHDRRLVVALLCAGRVARRADDARVLEHDSLEKRLGRLARQREAMVVLKGHNGAPRRRGDHPVRNAWLVPALAKFPLHRSDDVSFIDRGESACASREALAFSRRAARLWRRSCVGYVTQRRAIMAAGVKNGAALR
jgi:hypothetical protein